MWFAGLSLIDITESYNISKTIKTVDVEYYLSTSSSETTGGSWSTLAPTWENGKYMWSRQKVTYMDNTTSINNATCIAGAKGSTGATGTGITSIIEEYYLSTSKNSPTGGSWTTLVPSWSSGKYIWTRSKITYNNPTSVSYTEPLCSSEWEAINDIEVGGRNLLLKSDVSITNNLYHITSYELTENMIVDKEYTCRIWGSLGDGKDSFGIYIDGDGGSNLLGKLKNNNDGTYSLTFKGKQNPNYTGTTHYIYIYTLYNSVTVNSTINKIKLEYGNKATDWTKAPEDIDKKIDNIEVGGRNLLKNSNTFRLTGSDQPNNTTRSSTENKVVVTATGDDKMCNFYNWCQIYLSIPVEQLTSLEQDISFSLDVKLTNFTKGNVNFKFDVRNNNSSQKIDSSTKSLNYDDFVEGVWTRIKGIILHTDGVSKPRMLLLGVINGANEGATIEYRNLMIEVGNKATDWTPAPEDIDNKIDNVSKSVSEVVVGTQTSSTSAWTGVASFKELIDGQQITYWLPQTSAANATLNLTLGNGTTTGAKNLYYGGITRLGTHYPAGNAIHLTYRKNVTIGSSTNLEGWWADANYNTNDNNTNLLRFQQNIKVLEAVTAGQLISGTSLGFKKIAANVSFDLDKPILVASTSLSANGTGNNNYLVRPDVNIRTTLGNSNWTDTQYEVLYLVGNINGNTFTPKSPIFTTTKPNTESDLYYISLGYMYSTYEIILYPEHPIYKYINGQFKNISQIAYEAQVDVNDLEVGGRNLLYNTSGVFSNTGKTYSYGYWNVAKQTFVHGILLEANQDYVLSFDWTINWADSNSKESYYTSIGCGNGTDGSYSRDIIHAHNLNRDDINKTSGHDIIKFTPTSTDLATYKYFSMRILRTNTATSSIGCTITIKNLKLEKGNKATDWTPAPEDIVNKVDSLNVGGRNLLLNSNFDNIYTSTNKGLGTGIYAKYWGGYNSGLTNPTGIYHACIDMNTFGYNVYQYNESNGDRNWKAITQSIHSANLDIYKNICNDNSAEYIISMDVYQTVSGGKIWGGFHYYKTGTSSSSFYSGNFSIDNKNIPVGKWKRVSVKVPFNHDIIESKNYLNFYIYGYNFDSDTIVYIKNIKLEKGNMASDWTPAPEDISNELALKESKEEVEKIKNNLQTQITTAQSTIDSLKGVIQNLVVDKNGRTLMEQTGSGWKFNMSNIIDRLDDLATELATKGPDNTQLVSSLQGLLNSLEKQVAYVECTSVNNVPKVTLGASDSPFKVVITNTQISFVNGSSTPAYINGNIFYGQNITVKNQLKIGESPGFIWQKRSNGNLGLIYSNT